MKSQSSKTQAKVKAGAVGGSVGVALAALIIEVVEVMFETDLALDVEGTITFVVVGLVSWLFGYIKKPHRQDVNVPS